MLHAALLWGDFSLCLIGCAQWYCESSFLDNIFFFFLIESFFLAPLHGCKIRPDFESQLQRYQEYELALHEKEHSKSLFLTRGPCPTQLAVRPVAEELK